MTKLMSAPEFKLTPICDVLEIRTLIILFASALYIMHILNVQIQPKFILSRYEINKFSNKYDPPF